MPRSNLTTLARNKARTGLAFVAAVLVAPSVTALLLFFPTSLTPVAIIILMAALMGGAVPATLLLAATFIFGACFSKSRLAMVAAGGSAGLAYFLLSTILCSFTARPHFVPWLGALSLANDPRPLWSLRLGISAVAAGLLSGLVFSLIAMSKEQPRTTALK